LPAGRGSLTSADRLAGRSPGPHLVAVPTAGAILRVPSSAQRKVPSVNVIRRLSQLLMTTCGLLALTACASDGTQPDSRATADAQEDIGQLHAAFTKAFNAKD